MKGKSILSITSAVAVATAFAVVTVQGQSQSKDQQIESFIPKTKDHRFVSFVPKGHASPEGPAQLVARPIIDRAAQTGYDNLTNGYARQGPDFDKINEDNV